MDCDSFRPGLSLRNFETRTISSSIACAARSITWAPAYFIKLFKYICHRFAEVARSPSRGISRKRNIPRPIKSVQNMHPGFGSKVTLRTPKSVI